MGERGAGLTLRQERLVQAVLDPKIRTVTEAAEKAGYGHRETGSKMLRNPTVSAEIERRKASTSEKALRLQGRSLDKLGARVEEPSISTGELALVAKVATDVLERTDDVQAEAVAHRSPTFYRSMIRRGLCRAIPPSLRTSIRKTWRDGEQRWGGDAVIDVVASEST